MKKRLLIRKRCRIRRGLASLEAVAMTAVMVPFAGMVFYTGVSMCLQIYDAAANAICWPFM